MLDVKVLDLSWLLPGPYMTMLMADLGADVIKVERPGEGDYMRTLIPEVFLVTNRNKRSITLNLKSSEGQDALHELVRGADVLVEGFRPGVTARLRADYATLSAINPGLVYCSLSGYGQDGPYRDRPGHDVSYVGVGGGMVAPLDIRFPEARGASLPVADLASGMFGALSVAEALRQRERTGKGQYLDVSITDCVASWANTRLANTLWYDRPPIFRLNPTGRAYAAGDGRWLSISVTEDEFWHKLCEALGFTDWAADGRLATGPGRLEHSGEILERLEVTFRQRPRDEWLALFDQHDVPCGPVHDAEGVVSDPHLNARGLIWRREDAEGNERRVIGYPVRMSGTETTWRRMPPDLGEHTDEVLGEVGMDPEQIAHLRAAGGV
jgi:crotonobetainyl-CoA:carnitine CoA-transferase CaiB-like acyl-CoA transferase